jgi:hypothetical protein
MSSTNPQVYYENDENHGNYQYVSLEQLVNTFIQTRVGNGKILRNTPRKEIVLQMKLGIRQFNTNTLNRIKRVELNLDDAYYLILPPDFVDYTRISWLNKETGNFHPMSENRKWELSVSYLQDHEANILFDEDGEILKGTSATEVINDALGVERSQYTRYRCIEGRECGDCNCGGRPLWRVDTSANMNGYFNIDRQAGVIKFGSENASKHIILEYISDGLEANSESDIKIHKKAEQLLYAWTAYELMKPDSGIPKYEKDEAKKVYHTLLRNTKISMGNFRVDQLILLLSGGNKWIR